MRNKLSLRQCMVYPLEQLVHLSYVVQVMSDCFIRSLEVFGNLTTDLAVGLLYGHFQGLIIQDLQLTTAGFVTKRQIFRPGLLGTNAWQFVHSQHYTIATSTLFFV